MLWLYILIFLICCTLLYFSAEWVIGGLTRISRFLGWREFVVAFFVMAIAASLPNLFVGITSALHKIPQLSFGDVAGNNLVALTLAMALAVFFAGGSIPAESRTVQTTSIFTIIAAILPLLLILDGVLGKGDGIVLVLCFLAYIFWLFSKKERFTRVYDEHKPPITKGFSRLLEDLGKVILGAIFLVLAAQGIVSSAQFFAKNFNVSITLIGVLIIGLGSALPEIYFAIASAKKGETWMILGNLMGAVIVPATLVLGIVALICPIKIVNFSPLVIARFFLIISAFFFFFFVRTDSKITEKEGFFLFLIYISFLITEIIIK